MAPATDSIMGSLPREKAGVGSAVNDTTREVGGALGVAILGSILAASYSTAVGASAVVKALDATGAEGAKAASAVTSSIGGATQVAQLLGQLEQARQGADRERRRPIVDASNAAFVHAMGHTVIVGAVIAALGALVALVFLPSRPITTRSDVQELGDLGDLVVRGAHELADTGSDARTRPARRDAAAAHRSRVQQPQLQRRSRAGPGSVPARSSGTGTRSSTSSSPRSTPRSPSTPSPIPARSQEDCRTYLRETAESLSTPGLAIGDRGPGRRLGARRRAHRGVPRTAHRAPPPRGDDDGRPRRRPRRVRRPTSTRPCSSTRWSARSTTGSSSPGSRSPPTSPTRSSTLVLQGATRHT